MSRARMLTGLLVATLATTALAEDVVASSRDAISDRVAELTPPQGKKQRRELRQLKQAAAWLGVYDYAPDLDSSQALYRALRDAKRSRSKDLEVRQVIDDLGRLLGGVAAARVGEAELCREVVADEKTARRIEKTARRAGRWVDVADRQRAKNVLRAAELYLKAARKCGHAVDDARQEPLRAGAATIRTLHVSDSHSHETGSGPRGADLQATRGGVARVATIIGEGRDGRDDTLTVHTGDLFQGDPMFNLFLGVPGLQLLDQLGFDAMTVGNHEVGFGPELLAFVLNEAAGLLPPLLTANVDFSAYPVLTNWISPSMTKDISGLKVGMFGMTTPNDVTAMPEPLVIQTNLHAIVEAQIAALETQGAGVIVLLSHLGYEADLELARNVEGIDVILGGHDHLALAAPIEVIAPDGRTVRIAHVGEHYEYVGVTDLLARAGTVVLRDFELVATDATVPEEPTTAGVVASLQEAASAMFPGLYDTDVAVALDDIPRAPLAAERALGRYDGPMGGMLCDAYRAATGTEIAFTPRALVSEGVPIGHLVPADLYRVVSYGLDLDTGMGLQMATATISGGDLALALESTVSSAFALVNEDYVPEVSGLTFAFDSSQPPGSMLTEIVVGGEPLDFTRDYTLSMNVGTLSLLPMFGVEVTDVEVLPVFEFEVLMGYAMAAGELAPGTEFRARDVR